MHSSPTVVNGTVYIGAEASGAQERYLYAVDAVTGDQEWVSPNLGQGGLLESSPTVVGGSVYTGGANGLFSLDAGTGNKQWQHGDVSITESSPAVADERVYAGTEGGELHAVKATNGNVEFTYPLSDSEVKSSPTIADGTLYIGTDEGELRAIGDQNWTFTDPTDSIDSSPTVSGGAVYVTAQDSTLYAVDAAEGTQEWVFSLDGDTQVTS
jgi:outer membrane protein assembly factor BamB